MVLENVDLVISSRSYTNCLYSALSHCNYFSEPVHMLSGMTGMAFKFVIHQQLLPSSIDMYDWALENKRSVDNIGIYNEIYVGRKNLEIFKLYQLESIKKTKMSINKNHCVIAWGLDSSCFSLIYGYDDDDEVFYFINGNTGRKKVILYENYCKVSEGSWYYQLFGEKIQRGVKDIYEDSLLIAINEWEQSYKLGVNTQCQYASGKKAYDYLIRALKTGKINSVGPYYVVNNYIQSKQEICQYMKQVIKALPQHTGVYECYYKVNELFQSTNQLEFSGDIEKDKRHSLQLVEVFKQAQVYENLAIKQLKKSYHERLHNGTINIEKIEVL